MLNVDAGSLVVFDIHLYLYMFLILSWISLGAFPGGCGFDRSQQLRMSLVECEPQYVLKRNVQ